MAGADFIFPVPVDSKGTAAKEIMVPGKIKGEIRQGQKLGDLVIKFENQEVGRVDIVSPVNIPKANFFVRLLRKVGINL